jgi:hypothetical protein
MSKYIKLQTEATKDAETAVNEWRMLINDKLEDKVAFSYVKSARA